MTRGQNSLVIDMLDGATTDGERRAPPTCPP
jgi:hypothetical protein